MVSRVCFLVVAAACISLVTADAGQDLATLAADFYNFRLSQKPVVATGRGVSAFNDKLSNYKLNRFSGYLSTVNALYGRLNNIPVSELTKEDRMTYRVLQHQLMTYQEGDKWKYYQNLNPLNFLEGVHRSVTKVASNAPLDTRGDVENYLTRLESIPGQLTDITTSFQEAVRRGRAWHRVSVDRTPEQFDSLIAEMQKGRNSKFYIPLNAALSNITYTAEAQNTIRARADNALNSMAAAFQNLKAYIQNTYMTNTRQGYGVSSFPNGQEYYRAIMKWYLSLDSTPEDVHNMGLREVARIEKLMKEIMSRQGYGHLTVKQYFDMLKQDSRFFYNTGEELLDAYREIIREIDQKLPLLFKDIPSLPIVVEPMDTDGPQGMYNKGTPDGTRPGMFVANVLRPGEIPTFGLKALTFHEAAPGHHLQISIALTSSMPSFRQNVVYDNYLESPVGFPFYQAFSEGWALYAESLGEDMGIYKDDYELMGRYSSEMFRACRLVVDTGIHYFNWTRDQAVEYMLNYTENARSTLETEVDRYITWPGQALTYKTGELKIRELRDKARQRLGMFFDIKEFHAVILSNGRMPLNLIEDLVNDWLDNYIPPTEPRDCRVGGAGALASLTSLTMVVLALMQRHAL